MRILDDKNSSVIVAGNSPRRGETCSFIGTRVAKELSIAVGAINTIAASGSSLKEFGVRFYISLVSLAVYAGELVEVVIGGLFFNGHADLQVDLAY